MKKTTGIAVLALALMLIFTAVIGFGFGAAQSVYADGDAPEFEIEENVLVKYNGDASEVTVPDNVVKIGDSAFSGKTTLLKVILPESCKEIGSYSFAYCSSLVSINIEKVEKVGTYAFMYAGFTSFTVPGTIKALPEGMFGSCFYLAEVTISEGCETIGNNCFRENYALKEIKLPSTVSALGTYCFANCAALQSITLPEGITELPNAAFNSCGNLSTVNLPSTLRTIGASVFNQCWGLKTIELPEGLEIIGELTFASSALESITLPASVKDIRDWVYYTDDNGNEYIFNNHAFFNLSGLKEIKVAEGNEYYAVYDGALYNKDYSRLIIYPSSSEATKLELHSNTKYVMERAVQYAFNLKEVVLNEGLETVDHYAFNWSSNIEKIDLPSTLTTLGGGAFCGLSQVKYFVVPETVTVIGTSLVTEGTFQGCESAESINIPKNIQEIYGACFKDCKSLKTISIPKGLTELPNEFLSGCNSLEYIYVEDGNPNLISDNGTLYSDGGKTLVMYPFGIDALTYEVKEGTEKIEASAFYGNLKIVVITLPESVTSIGASAFQGCTNLVTVDMKNTSITEIPTAAFMNSGLSFIELPDSLRTIGMNAFAYCSNLKEIDLKNVNSLGMWSLAGTGLTELYIPDTVTSVETGVAQMCTSLVSIRFSAGMNYVPSAPLWGSVNVSEIIIPEGIERINGWTFSGLTALTTLNLPKTINYIDTYMYNSCPNIASIVIDPENATYTNYEGMVFTKDMTQLVIIPAALELDTFVVPDTVTDLPYGAFEGVNIKHIELPEGITYLQSGLFRSSAVESVKLPSTLNTLTYGMFQDCTKLVEVNLENIEYFEGSVFYNCESLTEFNFRKEGYSVEDAFSLFRGCLGLTEYVFPEGTVSIPQYIFESCTNLKKVTIPSTVNKIEMHAFDSCTALESIVVPSSVITTESAIFINCSSLKDVMFLGEEAPLFGSSMWEPEGNWFTGISEEAVLYVYDVDSYSSIGSYFKAVKTIESANMPFAEIRFVNNGDSVTVEWDEVFFANDYELLIDGEEVSVSGNSYVIEGVKGGSTINVTVKAIGDYGDYVFETVNNKSYTFAKTEIEELEDRISELEKKLADADSDKADLQDELNELKAALQAMTAERNELEEENEELYNSIDELNKKITQLQKDLNNANSCGGEVISVFGILALTAIVPVLVIRKKKED